jgi:hypothetical protein
MIFHILKSYIFWNFLFIGLVNVEADPRLRYAFKFFFLKTVAKIVKARLRQVDALTR